MKPAVVVGSAPCVHEDFTQAHALFPAWPLIVVNWAGLRHLGPIAFWASIHRRLIYRAIKMRKNRGGDMKFHAYIKIPPGEKIQRVDAPTKIKPFKPKMGSGSSGLFAVEVALKLGYDRLLLCGIPLEGDHSLQVNDQEEERIRFGKPFVESFRKAWLNNYDTLKPVIRSMSGWTKEQFGGVEEWINEQS
jgi:hypothetical protein